jgi:predicted PurR-regulated permease PerM
MNMPFSTLSRSSGPLSGYMKALILFLPLLVISVFALLFTNIFIMLVICLLLALVLNPFVDFLESRGVNRTLSILIVYAVIGFLLYLILQLLIPVIVEQSASLRIAFKEFEFSDKLKSIEKWLEINLPFMKKGDIAREVETAIKGSYTKIQYLISGVFETAIIIIIIPVVTFFILRDRKHIKKGLLSLVPNRYFEMTINIIDKIERQLSRYVRGWLFDAFFVGALSTLGLSLLGIDYSVVIGLVAGIGHLIPYAGPIIGGIPAIIISIIQFGDFHMVLPIVLMFTIVYLLDNSVAQPYIFSKSVGMNPITIITLLLIGNEILGAFGLLIAIPVATILIVSARETINGFRNYGLAQY